MGGRDFINLFFPKDVYRHSLFFFLAHHTRQCFRKEQKEKYNDICVQAVNGFALICFLSLMHL